MKRCCTAAPGSEDPERSILAGSLYENDDAKVLLFELELEFESSQSIAWLTEASMDAGGGGGRGSELLPPADADVLCWLLLLLWFTASKRKVDAEVVSPED